MRDARTVLDFEDASFLIAVRADLTSADGLFDSAFLLKTALTGGDDYELVFTAPPTARSAVQAASERAATPVTRIGRIEAAPGLYLADADGRTAPLAARAFDHFA